MAVVISHQIKKREFKKGIIPSRDLDTILKSFQGGIFTLIKGKDLPRGSRLIKIYATTIQGARRIIFLVDVESNDAFFLMYRSKNDTVGKNVSIQNSDFRKLLHTYLELLASDIDTDNVDVYEI